eukprot:jgi/Bigna1/50129/estExt_Genewise1.C_670064
MPLLNIRGIIVDFPHDPYDCQLVYMEKVIEALQENENALLESPTGTGKTLCLLCAILGWRHHHLQKKKIEEQQKQAKALKFGVQNDGEGMPNQVKVAARVVYSSRTHGQLSQVVKELKKTIYRPNISILGSRQQMCIHPRISEEQGTRQNHACRMLVNRRGCNFYNNVDKATNGSACSGGVMDIEDFVEMGRQQDVCPYFYTRNTATNADMVFLPYNYLIDPKIRSTLNLDLRDSIVVFDEAHNVPKVAAEAVSFDLGGHDVAACIKEISRCLEAIRDPQGNLAGIDLHDMAPSESDLIRIKEILLDFEEKVQSIDVPRTGYILKDGTFVFQLLQSIGITLKSKEIFTNVVMKAATLILTINEISNSSKKKCALQELVAKINIVFPPDTNQDLYSEELQHYKTIDASFHQGKAAAEKVLSYWCFNSGLAMQTLRSFGVRSILLTSGTLSPMDSMAYDMKIPFKIRLENPHIVKPDQIWLGALSKGPNGAQLNGTYKNRSSREYQRALGISLVNLSRVVPHGMLVFFPSYAALNTVIEAWRMPGQGGRTIMEQMEKHKFVVVEPRHSSQFAPAMDSYRAKVEDPSKSGAMLFAVCRGKSSEGMDFSGRQCRAVVVVGIPYPNSMDLRVRIKMQIMDKQQYKKTATASSLSSSLKMSGNQWYLHQAACAVNQAVGRVIRHRFDFGAVVLCDHRFSRQNVRDTLSLWLKPHLQSQSSFGSCLRSVTQFFKNVRTLGLDNRAGEDKKGGGGGSAKVNPSNYTRGQQREEERRRRQTAAFLNNNQRKLTKKVLQQDFDIFKKMKKNFGSSNGENSRRSEHSSPTTTAVASATRPISLIQAVQMSKQNDTNAEEAKKTKQEFLAETMLHVPLQSRKSDKDGSRRNTHSLAKSLSLKRKHSSSSTTNTSRKTITASSSSSLSSSLSSSSSMSRRPRPMALRDIPPNREPIPIPLATTNTIATNSAYSSSSSSSSSSSYSSRGRLVQTSSQIDHHRKCAKISASSSSSKSKSRNSKDLKILVSQAKRNFSKEETSQFFAALQNVLKLTKSGGIQYKEKVANLLSDKVIPILMKPSREKMADLFGKYVQANELVGPLYSRCLARFRSRAISRC